MHHVISWSGGKDSTASIILFHENFDKLCNPEDTVTIIFAEVMYDLKRNISGHNPEIIKFIYDKAEVFRSWGFNVEILRSDKDFLYCFNRKLSNRSRPDHRNRPHGFMLTKGRCDVKRDCKLAPIARWKKSLKKQEEFIEYIGIAVDEPKRFSDLSDKKQSILIKFGYTESDARSLCEKYDMLSPQYSLDAGRQERDGCWFCPNARLCEFKELKKNNPSLWNEFVSLESIPNLVYPSWGGYKNSPSLDEIDKNI